MEEWREYNKVKTGDEIINNQRFRFIISDYPLEATVEFWVLDLINNVWYTNVRVAEMCGPIRILLLERKLDGKKLQNMAEQYCKPQENMLILTNVIKQMTCGLELLAEDTCLKDCRSFINENGFKIDICKKRTKKHIIDEVNCKIARINNLVKKNARIIDHSNNEQCAGFTSTNKLS